MEKFKSPFLWINGEKSKSLHLSDILTNQNHLFSVLVPHIDAVVARILVGKVPEVKSQLDQKSLQSLYHRIMMCPLIKIMANAIPYGKGTVSPISATLKEGLVPKDIIWVNLVFMGPGR